MAYGKGYNLYDYKQYRSEVVWVCLCFYDYPVLVCISLVRANFGQILVVWYYSFGR